MRRVEWTQTAADDLREAEQYLASYHPSLARDTVERTVAAARFLLDCPSIGTPVTGLWLKWRLPKTRYLLIYRSLKDGVEIARVRFDRGDWTLVPS